MLSLPWIVALNLAGWPVIQLGLAWWFIRMPVAWFVPPAACGWERDGAPYRRFLHIQRWKDHLPDGAKWFGRGFPKGTLARRDPEYLRRFMAETWRGELCHWCTLACAPVFFLWNPWWADLVMVVYAVAANLPCILAQRYNRLRLAQLIGRRPP